MKATVLMLTVVILILSILTGFLFFKLGYKDVKIPEETAIELAKTITVLRPSFITSTIINDYVKGTALGGFGEYLINAEKSSGIGADYLLAIMIHESGWGSGPWIKNGYKAYFSWGITDSGPNSEAGKVKNMSVEDGIVYVANQIKVLYLTKGGAYYKGETLSAIGTYYASDGSWASNVINIHAKFTSGLSEEIKSKQWAMSSRILFGDLPSPIYITNDYLTRAMTREELIRILYRINVR
jgi:hypothetical protein